MSRAEEASREKVYDDLRLPPFASVEPIQRFEAQTGAALPADLKMYLLNASRELTPQALYSNPTATPRLGLAFLYEPGPATIAELLIDDEEIGGRQDGLQRLCPSGTLRRELFDRISGGVCPWRYKDIVPYLIAYDQLVHDPTQGVANMRTEVLQRVALASLAHIFKRLMEGESNQTGAERWLLRVAAVTGMTQEEMCFDDAEVDVLVLCYEHDFRGRTRPVLGLVTSDGPYRGWCTGWHRMNCFTDVASAFPSFSKFRLFTEEGLDYVWSRSEYDDEDISEPEPEDQDQLNEVLRLVAEAGSLSQPDDNQEDEDDEEEEVEEEEIPPRLVLPPFPSEEPIVRFETAAGVRLPEDLRSYLLNESREYPIEDNTYKAYASAMLYRVCSTIDELVLFEDEDRREPDAIAERLLRAGSYEKDVYDRAGARPHTIPYYMAHADLQQDSSLRTTKMRKTHTSRETLTCLAASGLYHLEDGLDHSVDFVRQLLAKTDMTLGQLVFPDCKVDVLPLSRSDVGYARLALVTTPGPYQGWIIGSHIMNSGYFTAGFPSFSAYRQFKQSGLHRFEHRFV